LVQDARNSDEVRKALALVEGFEIVWPSRAECQTALDQFAKLHLSHSLGLLDALIAATAVGHGSVLNTFNERHYRMFPGLAITRPYQR
jgi:predicted nucleic acid-binding protein